MHRYAVLAAVWNLLLVATGALVTDYDGLALPRLVERTHLMAAAIGAVLMFILAIRVSSGERGLAWMAFAALLLEGALGTRAALLALPRLVGILHAILAQLLFAATVVIAVFTSRDWKLGPEPVQDQGWPPLRSLARFALFLVVVQLTLGASFRHKAASVLPHIIGAMVVALMILILCMCVMQPFPKHRSLRPATNMLLGLTITQVFLGITALTMRLMISENTVGVMLATVAHVSIGATVLAATVILALQIRRNVQRA